MISELLELGVNLFSLSNGTRIKGFCYTFDIVSRKTISNSIACALNMSDVAGEL